ncbi:MAG: glutathione S-transferase family protein [Alphaproteobacteria bacterium]|nr:glutathione S-transferase family protein [Alphaproteobacteria bacterium]
MLLRTSLTSPFGRKTRMAAIQLGLMDRIRIENSDPTKDDDPIRRENPLGKIPALIPAGGKPVYDSRVILEYLDHLAGGGKILPVDFDARIHCLTMQALGDGIMDAAILIVYEARHRPEAIHHKPWLEYQRGKVERGLAAFAAAPPDPKTFNAGTIALACALGYIDWRKQVDWRALQPSLIGWLDAFSAAHPAFEATRPPV